MNTYMLYKCQVALILLLPISFSILSGIAYNISIAAAREDNANFLTYTNPDLGFTIKYPPYWTVDESNIAIRNEVIFVPPNKGAIVGVMINNLTPEEAALINASSSAITNASANQIPSNLSSSVKLLVVPNATCFLVIMQLDLYNSKVTEGRGNLTHHNILNHITLKS